MEKDFSNGDQRSHRESGIRLIATKGNEWKGIVEISVMRQLPMRRPASARGSVPSKSRMAGSNRKLAVLPPEKTPGVSTHRRFFWWKRRPGSAAHPGGV